MIFELRAEKTPSPSGSRNRNRNPNIPASGRKREFKTSFSSKKLTRLGTSKFRKRQTTMASTNADPPGPIALRQSIENFDPQISSFSSSTSSRDNHQDKDTIEMLELEQYRQDGDFTQDNCDAEHDHKNGAIKALSTSKATSQTVTPYLIKHIPNQYAPLGPPLDITALQKTKPKDPNSKYCYRHRPDRMCRRTADEETMEYLQRVRIALGLLIAGRG